MAFTVDIKGNASHLDKTLKGVKTSLGSIGSVAGSVTTALAGMGTVSAAALGAFVVTSSKAASKVEDLALQFEVLTGSAKISKDLLAAFRKEEEKSALSLEDYGNAAKTLLAFGTSADQVLPSLKTLADVSMGNSERFGSLALAFAQTSAAGRLMGQEVLQFVNAGFNPLQQISIKTGESMAQLKKRMEEGKVSVAEVKQAFIDATSEGGRFYKAIDKGSTTTSAKLNQLDAAVTRLQAAFGTGFNEGLKDALDASSNFLPKLEAIFTEAGEIVGSAISDAVAGDYERFALIGGVIGEAVVAGFKAVTISSLEGIGNTMLEHIAQAVENDPLLGGAPSLNDKGRGKNAFGDMIRENLTTSESSDNLAYRIAEELNKSEAPKMLQQLQELNRTGKSQLEKLEKLKQFQNAKFTN
jgi:tape measure domain-containing protein